MRNPHAGRELELTILGSKPFCFLDAKVYPKQYQEALNLVNVYSVVSRGPGMVTVCRKEKVHLQTHYEDIMATKYDCAPDKHRALGELFGYKKSEVEAFIEAKIKCPCKRCTNS